MDTISTTGPAPLITPKMLREAIELPLSLVANTPAAQALVEAVVAQVVGFEQATGRRRRGTSELAKLKGAAGAIVGGLLRLSGKTSPALAFRSSHKESFNGATVGFRQFDPVMKALVTLGLIGRHKGITYDINDFGGPFAPRRLASRYWPTPVLLSLAAEHGVCSKDDFRHVFSTTPPKVTCVLRLKSPGRNDKELPFDPEEQPAISIREGVEAHNQLAEATSVTGCLPPRWCRIFTVDWTMHGRWYALGSDGNYQRLSERQRLQITIGGEPVAEVDIRASSLTLMHGLLGLPAPDGDPYEIAGVPRGAVKSWVVISLGKGSPVVKWPGDTSDEVRAFDPREVAKAVIGRYPFMAEPWKAVERWRPQGDPKKLLVHYLMGLEASILSRAMSHLRGPEDYHLPRVLSLPMHDGLIVPVSAIERAKADLGVAGEVLGNVRLNLKVSRADG